ncbi:hypothetical protein H5410_030400 [Solanum commersonii]|uniref:Uncharacterized protein n=1 Tax=Solanum commersonii TaxID=4109 RepID=A0A9J5YJ83_SOLCO|nr:hypothetical protein H5410_030400 [Solanum commersonii]
MSGSPTVQSPPKDLENLHICSHPSSLSAHHRWEEIEAPEACEEEERADVPEGLEVGVGNDASAGIEPMSTSGDVSTGVALLMSASSCVYLASIHRMPVEEERVT